MNQERINIEYTSRINKTFDYIESHLPKPITLDELASVANFSKFHFSSVFHALVGETPFQFILRVRIERATLLITINKLQKLNHYLGLQLQATKTYTNLNFTS